MTKLLSRFRRGHPDIDSLSAYVDAEPDSRTASELVAHVTSCAECGRRLQELREVRAALQSMPSADVPRSFRLRAADVETPAHGRNPSPGPGVLRLMPATSALAIVLFAALVGADLLSNRDSGSATLATRALDNAPQAAQSNQQAPVPGSPQAASKAEAGASTQAATARAGAITIAPAPGDVAVPSASEGLAVPSSADAAPPPNNAAPGTFGSPPPSSTETAPADAAVRAAQPPRAPEFGDTHVTPGGGSDHWSGLRIAEAIVAALAIGSGGIAAVRWMMSREV